MDPNFFVKLPFAELVSSCNKGVSEDRSESAGHSLGAVLGSELSLELMAFVEKLANNQTQLDPEVAKVLPENLWDLYAD